MKRKTSLALTVLLLALTSMTSLAQSSGDYDLAWSSIDGGGGESSGNGFTLISTIGQSDAGTLHGGAYTLNGGFLASIDSASRLSDEVYLPLIRR